jgi:hypothetical protein
MKMLSASSSGDDALGDAIGNHFGNGVLRGAEHLSGLLGTFDR